MKQQIWLTMLLAGGLFCGPLSATDILNLRNGTSYRGTFLRASGDRIRFQERRGAPHTFRSGDVSSIRFDVGAARTSVPPAPPSVALDQDRIVLRNGRTEDGRLLRASANRIEIETERGRRRSVPIRRVAMIEMHGWSSSSLPYGETGWRSNGADRIRNRGQRFADGGNLASLDRMVIPDGTIMAVRTDQRIDSRVAGEGEVYPASVTTDVFDANGQVAIPRGSEAELVIRRVDAADRGQLQLDLQSVNVNGVRYNISTEDIARNGRQGLGINRRTGEMVGGGAAIGSILGAIVGGGKGAALGAAIGAAGGAATQVLTRGDHVSVPAETELDFRLDRPVVMQAYSGY